MKQRNQKHLAGKLERLRKQKKPKDLVEAQKKQKSFREKVASFNGENRAVSLYDKHISKTYQATAKEGAANGFGMGSVFLIIFASYGLAIWYGGQLIINKGYSGGTVISVLLAVLIGASSLGNAAPCVTAFAEGQTAAYWMFETIKRKPDIDAYDESGVTLEKMNGDVELREVYFSYPARPEQLIFNGFSLRVDSGTTMAIVGESGSGKSTVISLVERFYDPQAGEVLIDGVNIKTLKLGWIREKIGLVSQEPLLFMTTIKDNILYGKEGATLEEVTQAVELANAANFIDKSPVITPIATGWAAVAGKVYEIFSCNQGFLVTYYFQILHWAICQVFFALLLATTGISQTSALGSDSAKARDSAISIFEIVDRKSKIDPGSEEGQVLEIVRGDIELRHISFRYPTRPDVPIFTNLSLSIPSGKTIALVGESGSGKSTVIALLERFYDPDSGNILLDGTEITTLNVRWLRKQMGLVSQEPVLFDDTIRANISYGKEGEVTEEELIAVAEASNAHQFISSLPQGYDTYVGERGIQLSGGQKQRVAIARAILKNPKILLLDEATSALDAESEHVVQEALDTVMVGRTTIVVAHRLSTIKGADIIAVVKNGEIVEKGRHETLMRIKDGVYVSLVELRSN
ncbi:ABC transporter B family member 21-like [Carex rostrata]